MAQCVRKKRTIVADEVCARNMGAKMSYDEGTDIAEISRNQEFHRDLASTSITLQKKPKPFGIHIAFIPRC